MMPMRTPRSMADVSCAERWNDGTMERNATARTHSIIPTFRSFTVSVPRNKTARRECPESNPEGVRRITDAGPAPRSRLPPPDRTRSCRNAGRIAGPSPNHRDGQETKLPLPAVCVAQDVSRGVAPATRYSADTRGTGTPRLRCSPWRRRCPSRVSRPAMAAWWTWSAAPPRGASDPASAAASPARRCFAGAWQRESARVSPRRADRKPRGPCAIPCPAPARPPDARDRSAAAGCARCACRTTTRSAARESRACPSLPCLRGPECGRVLSSIDRLRFGYESHVLYACAANHRQHLHHASVVDAAIGPQIHPGGPFRSHKGWEGGLEIVIRERCLIEIDLPVHIDRDDQPLFRLDGAHLRARQSHIDTALHDRRSDHENDEQHERDVHERGHVDVGVERQLSVSAEATTTTAAEESCH